MRHSISIKPEWLSELKVTPLVTLVILIAVWARFYPPASLRR